VKAWIASAYHRRSREIYVLSAFPELFVATLCPNDEAPARAADEVLIVPQFRYSRYRADLAVRFPWLPRRHWVFVECDGREFHSSDRQVEQDRGRQQEMMDAGFCIFRFTGKQIWRDADVCACAVAEHGLAQRTREKPG
jgi:very-short-patch-repair endonuclease